MAEIHNLVKRCQQGDALAWEALVLKLQSRIYGLAYAYVHNQEDAFDLAQEIFVRIYQSMNQCRDLNAFMGWVLSLGRHVCVDWIRRLKARPQTSAPLESIAITDDQPTPEAAFHLGTRKKLVYRALERLTLASREMIILKEIQGMKFREISQMLNIPEGTVKSRSGRARVELAKAVLELEPGFDKRATS